ncbi:diacylglycerol/lipid kinase family protein [Lysinimonas soli]|uniref:Diacylglycerol/lipid kinase family protein n=1 Tax=Lysinimonas soli TaxID=1074233 RepID=A0ABW0NS08_9MICO
MADHFQVKRVVVAINPSASFGTTRDIGPAVVQTLRAMGHEVTSLTEPDYESLLTTARAAVRSKPDGFVVVGGDGMVNLGANLLAGTKVPLGIVPSGTGNDMARSLGLPFDDTEASVDALAEALQHPPRVVDAGLIHYLDDDGVPAERWFACSLSAGFDATVNERANLMRHPRGPSRYIIALGIELVRLKPIHYTVTLDDREFVVDANMVSIGNGISLGGGMKITPDARLDDGLLDVMIVRPLSRLNFIRIFPSVFKGTHVRHPKVSIDRARRVRIAGEGVIVYADGERIGRAPIDVELVPGALRVLAATPT